MSSRLFVHHRTDPHFNMGFDEWMLHYVSANPQSLIWRLYSWEVGTITFGFNQRQDTAYDERKLGGTPAIRRITGGRAVFHDISELTYAVAFNYAAPVCPELSESPAQSSEFIAEILSAFLQQIGIDTQWEKASSPENSRSNFFHKAACFASHARHELTSGGTKIVASARRDWNGGVLQHGSIKLAGLQLHPALHHQPQVLHVPSKSIELSELNSYAEVLSGVLGERLGITPAHDAVMPREEAEIALCVGYVRAHAFDKRDLFAQFEAVGSQ